MKTVGKQLQEARLAKNWTPELAARETKIKVERLLNLEADDYSHFASPTYARGFVRTYARFLGLDEYKILRQLDNKLPDDDSANIVTETGVAYLPETSMPPRAAHRDYTGLYIVMALGAVVTLAIVIVLFEAYRVGELSNWFASNSEPAASGATSGTNADGTPAGPATNSIARALPIDSNTPPPVPVEITNAPADTAPGPVSPKALPVDPSALVAGTNAAPNPDAPVQAVRALPVDPSELTNAAPATTASSKPAPSPAKTPPRALPVDPSDLATPPGDPPAAPVANATVAVNTLPAGNATNSNIAPPVATQPPAPPKPSSSARQSNNGPVMEPPAPESAPVVPEAVTDPSPSNPPDASSGQRLVLTASRDSFVRVTSLDASEADQPLYAAVLHSGQSVGFKGHKFSVNVGVPSAVDIKLDGVNYGPHSDQEAPETFTVQSHLP